MSVLQLSRLVPLHVQRGFHPRQADLNRPLHYLLGECCPSQTARQTLFPRGLRFSLPRGLEFNALKSGISLTAPPNPKIGTQPPLSRGRAPPTYATHENLKLNIKLQ